MNKKLIYIIVALAVAYAIYYFMTYSYDNKNGNNVICFGRNAYKIKKDFTAQQFIFNTGGAPINTLVALPTKEYKQGECVFATYKDSNMVGDKLLVSYDGFVISEAV